MAGESLEFRISLQRLLAALILVLVPVALFGLYIALQADNHVQQMNGAHFRTITRASAASVSKFIDDRITDVGVLANEPSVTQAVTAANRAYERLTESAIRDRSSQIESRWNSSEADPLVEGILTSDLARLLRRHRELNPELLKITVTDATGATIAATDKPLHYIQASREDWRVVSGPGQGAVYVTEARHDEQTRSNYVGITYPVRREGTGRFSGAVFALVDLSALLNHLNQQQIARTGRVFLVRDDGLVLSGPGVTPSMKLKSDEYSAIRDALGTLSGREAGYMNATLPDGKAYLIGFADTGLKQSYANLGWVVVASQEEREASGPIRSIANFALFVVILALLMLTVLAAHVFLHRTREFADLDVPPQEKRRSAAA
jgi:hypothetical protein